MQYYCAPLEGVTTYGFRNAHRKYFGGVDRYFTPFIPTNQNHKFSNREMRDVLPAHNPAGDVVPQLLSKVSEDFIQAAAVLGEMGYDEVNLNLGCPSRTVVAKGKGSGGLIDLMRLDRFLDEIFEGARIKISIKTRLGLHDPDEFEEILEVYNRYPISELTVHPRVQKDYYQNNVRMEHFQWAVQRSCAPLCYNGDLKTVADCDNFTHRFPSIDAVMIGRGLVRNPALVRQAKGGAPADRETLRAFQHEIHEECRCAFQNDRNAMLRMKELWSYLIGLFVGGEELGKKLRKAEQPSEFNALIDRVFQELPLVEQ